MIIDCHGHYTTAPDALGRHRDAQRAELEKDPTTQGSKGLLGISDQEIRDSLEGAQLAMQAERAFELRGPAANRQCRRRNRRRRGDLRRQRHGRAPLDRLERALDATRIPD